MDQQQDTGSVLLYKLAKLYNAPDYVKEASSDDLCGDLQLKTVPAAFADPTNMRFPIHSKAAVWASYAYFLENEKSYSTKEASLVESRILSAAKLAGCANDIKLLKSAHTAAHQVVTSEELPDECFAYVARDDSGNVERHLPMRNALEVRKAAEFIEKHRIKFRFEDRRDMSERILNKAAAYGVDLSAHREYLEKQAGRGLCVVADVAQALLTRVAVSRKHRFYEGNKPQLDSCCQEMEKLASDMLATPGQFHSLDARLKLASIIDNFDRATGLVNEVVRGNLQTVEDVCFPLTAEKMASAQKDHTSTVTGNIYRIADIEKLKLSKLSACLGEDIAEAITSDGLHINGEKAAEVIPTLPRPEAELFDRMMAEIGGSPVFKEASATSIRLDHTFLQDMARRYNVSLQSE